MTSALPCPPRVLCIDDEPLALRAMRRCLEAQGELRVQIASNAEEARRLLLAYGLPLSLLLVDLDGLKAVDDGHGHLVGDRVLQAVAGMRARRAG